MSGQPTSLSQVLESVHAVRPYRWLNRGLTVTMMGQYGMYDIAVVREPGWNGEVIGDGTVVFSEVKV